MPPLVTKTSNSTNLELQKWETLCPLVDNWEDNIWGSSWFNPLLSGPMYCFFLDPEPYQGLLLPGRQHLIFPEYCFLATA